MRILKITDGFITNSSSDSATIIIALRKGKRLKDIMESLTLPRHLPKNFHDFSSNLNDIEDYGIEIDHLIGKYNILIKNILTWENEDGYEIPTEELNAIIWMVKALKIVGGEDLKVLFFRESSMS